jgi:hypothetical protein
MGKAKHALARTFAMGDMADRKDEEVNRPAFEKARAEKQCQAKNGHDESRLAKRHDVHEGHINCSIGHEKARQHVVVGSSPTMDSGRTACDPDDSVRPERV